MQIDSNSLKQLEVFGHKGVSLNVFFKHTFTSAGSALLDFELCHHLISLDAKKERQCVFFLPELKFRFYK